MDFKVYRKRPIIIWIIGPVSGIIFGAISASIIWLLYTAPDKFSTLEIIGFLVMAVLFALLSLCGFLVYRNRLELDSRNNFSIGFFRKKTYYVNNFDGFRTLRIRGNTILALKGHLPQTDININVSGFDGFREIMEWFEGRITNDDEVEYQHEIAKISEKLVTLNVLNGTDKNAFEHAKRAARYLLYFTLLFSGLQFIPTETLPNWLHLIVVAPLFVVSPAGICLIKKYQGFIKFDATPNSPYASVIMPLMISVLALAWHCSSDCQVMDINHLLPFFTLVSLLTIFIACHSCREGGKGAYAIVSCTFLVWSFALSFFINRELDTSPPVSHTVKITGLTHDKYTQSLLINGWPDNAEHSVNVDEDTFRAAKPEEQQATLVTGNGFLEQPWIKKVFLLP